MAVDLFAYEVHGARDCSELKGRYRAFLFQQDERRRIIVGASPFFWILQVHIYARKKPSLQPKL
ncbi:MAG: hypothetical protein ACJAXK_000801 [Yoonia sp.]|jgi:hypothetical protein